MGSRVQPDRLSQVYIPLSWTRFWCRVKFSWYMIFFLLDQGQLNTLWWDRIKNFVHFQMASDFLYENLNTPIRIPNWKLCQLDYLILYPVDHLNYTYILIMQLYLLLQIPYNYLGNEVLGIVKRTLHVTNFSDILISENKKSWVFCKPTAVNILPRTWVIVE